jgi:dimeric dUTPase (all-alpha-NTP-PPase superfamily)
MTEAIMKHVPVPKVDADFGDMYVAQCALQERLNQLPIDTTNYSNMAAKCIYWAHCVRAEARELLDWTADEDIKELQMEAIDIIHFVFNIGVESGHTGLDIIELEEAWDHMPSEINFEKINAVITILDLAMLNFIAILPWKTWKNYKIVPSIEVIKEGYNDVFRAALFLCNVANLDRQDIINMYFAKNKVNHNRQTNGY